MVCRSSSATSGFKDKSGTACSSGGGTIVLESHGHVYGPGGQGVYDDPTYGPVLYYHYGASTLGYECFDCLTDRWNVVLLQSTRGSDMPTATSSLAGTRSTSRRAGPLCKAFARSLGCAYCFKKYQVDWDGGLAVVSVNHLMSLKLPNRARIVSRLFKT